MTRHITVLDIINMRSRPYGTMLLADLEVRTIKVEPPGTGEGNCPGEFTFSLESEYA